MIDATLMEALRALSPIIERIVVVGGAAHRIHAQLAGGEEEPLMTEDVDMVICQTGQLPDVSEALEAADFVGVPRGVKTPPSMIYRTQNGSYLQFLCRRRGAPGGRDGNKPGIETSYGLVAESMAHVDILAFEPQTFEVPNGATPLLGRVAHPACFILQKSLIWESRGLEERAKDLLYVHDTLRLFDPLELRETALRAWETLTKRERRKVARWRSVVLDPKTDLPFSAANIANASGRAGQLTGESLLRTSSHGFELLLD